MDKLIVVCRDITGGPALLGLSRLSDAAKKRGIALEYLDDWNQSGSVLVAGLTTDRFIARMLARESIQVENKPEGVLLAGLRHEYGTRVAVAAGTDEIGLMYALCEMADRIGNQELPALDL